MSRICEAAGCENSFEPLDPSRRFCSRRCAVRTRVARYRARHRNNGSPAPPPQAPPPGGGPGGGVHPAYMGEGLSIAQDDRLPVIGPKKRPAKSVPTPLPMFPENPRAGGLSDAA